MMFNKDQLLEQLHFCGYSEAEAVAYLANVEQEAKDTPLESRPLINYNGVTRAMNDAELVEHQIGAKYWSKMEELRPPTTEEKMQKLNDQYLLMEEVFVANI